MSAIHPCDVELNPSSAYLLSCQDKGDKANMKVLPLITSVIAVSALAVIFWWPSKSENFQEAGAGLKSAGSQEVGPGLAIELMEKSELVQILNQRLFVVQEWMPHESNLHLALTTAEFSEKDWAVEFEYEVAIAFDDARFTRGDVRQKLMRRYCRADEFRLIAINGIASHFEYERAGLLIHRETIDRCDTSLEF